MNLRNLRLFEKSLSGSLSPREQRYLEKLRKNNSDTARQLDDFGEIRRAISGTHYRFSPGFTGEVMSALEKEPALPVTILFADIFQRAFLRVAMAGVGLLLILVTLFSINRRQQESPYPAEVVMASESLLFDYYYYEMN
ncbi:MAG: hypothetical protein ACOYXB_13200 [Bacteroidota bacterium]